MQNSAITFIHTADIHFGVENYGRIDPKTGIHTRLLDFEKSLSLVIDRALQEQVDIFLFAGDAYKTPYPTPTQQKLLLSQFLRLQQAQIPVVIVVGNHDHPLSFGRAHALDVFGNIQLEHFHVFSRPESKTIITKRGPVQIVGVPWPMRNNVMAKNAYAHKTAQEITSFLSSQVSSIIQKYAQELRPEIPTFLVGHLTVANGIFSGSEKCAVYGTDPLFLPSQLAIPPFDYVALGHLHRFQNLNKGGVPVVYSGSPERVDFGERKEPKGFCLGSVSMQNGEKKTNFEFVELPVRPMIQIDVTIQAEQSQTEQVLTAVSAHDLSGAIVKVVYYLPEGSVDSVDTAAVQRACASAHYITGIQPVHKVVTRATRAQLTAAMKPEELLGSYLKSQQLSPQDMARLTEKAQALLAEHQEKQERGDEAFDD